MNKVCKHCKKEFDITDKPTGWIANHTRWCDYNPKKISYKNGALKAVHAMNAARKQSGITNQYTKARKKGTAIPESPLRGKTVKGHPHTENTKILLREKALASKHRRLRRKLINYNGIMLDSTWELALAKRLDLLSIKWTRPDPIEWLDSSSVKHNYFPDFYLIEYDVYLDPKNPQAIKVQQEKLKMLLTQYSNICIIETLEKCETFTLDDIRQFPQHYDLKG